MLPALKLCVKSVISECCFPWEIAGKHAEEEHAKRPDVLGCCHYNAFGACDLAHLGGGVRDGPAHTLDTAAGASRHPKVTQLHVSALAVEEEHVLWFDVSMDQIFTVHEIQGQAKLLYTTFYHVLR